MYNKNIRKVIERTYLMSNLSLLKKEALKRFGKFETEFATDYKEEYEVEGWAASISYTISKKSDKLTGFFADISMVENGKDTYKVAIYAHSETLFGPADKLQINWSAYGSLDIVEAEKFIDTLRVTEQAARHFENKLIFKNEEDF